MKAGALLVTLAIATACGAAPEAEVGTGSFEYVSLPDDGAVKISCGSQGGPLNHHLWTSVRARGVGPENVTLKLDVVDPATGAKVCQAALNGLLLDDAGDWEEFNGIRCFVGDADHLVGRTLRLEADLTDADGHAAHAEHVLVPSGFDASCGG